MTVLVTKRIKNSSFSTALIRGIATAVLGAIDAADAEVSISIVGPRTMARLNGEYRDKPQPTDVLSFAMEEGEDLISPVRMLGDVVICETVLLRQAREYDTTPTEELVRLMVHGMLHLTGYDHMEAADGRVMRKEERRLHKAVDKALGL